MIGLLPLVLIISACGEQPANNSQAITISTQRSGQQLYVSCQACHGPMGQGITGMAPPLVNSAILASDEHSLLVLRNGYKSGRQYAAIMTGFERQFSDQELVTLINWMRGRWTPASPDTSLEQVQALRRQPLLGRQASPSDL
jgi:mono/diheme cytochrome c family protein